MATRGEALYSPPMRLLLLLLVVASSACTPSICARKDKFFTQTCNGSALSYTGDPYCDTYMANCSDKQIAQAEGYVACLEATGQCSQAALSGCQAQFPGGVNLMCTPLPPPS